MLGDLAVIPVGQEPPPLPVTCPPDGPDNQPPQKLDGKTKRPRDYRKTGNRFAVLNEFVDCCMTELSKVELAVWLTLYRDTWGGTACVSMDDIARRAGCTKRAVVKAIQKLLRRRLLVRVSKGGLNRGPSRYRVVSDH